MVYIKITGFQKRINALHKAKETFEAELKVTFILPFHLSLPLSPPRHHLSILFRQARQESSQLQQKEEEEKQRLAGVKVRRIESKKAVEGANLQRYKEFQEALSRHRTQRIQILQEQAGGFITTDNLLSKIEEALSKKVSYNSPLAQKSTN